jgi:hypothetical protein
MQTTQLRFAAKHAQKNANVRYKQAQWEREISR